MARYQVYQMSNGRYGVVDSATGEPLLAHTDTFIAALALAEAREALLPDQLVQNGVGFHGEVHGIPQVS